MSVNHPSQFDPAKFGTLRFAFARGPEDFPANQRAWIGEAVFACRALGFEIDWVDPADADRLIQHWRDSDPEEVRSPGRTTFELGNPPLIEIDPARCAGESQFRKAVVHEVISSFRGTRHIRHDASEGEFDDAGERFSPVGTGVAVMNQRMGYGQHDPIGFETFNENIEPTEPTALDIAEFNRVRAGHE